MLYCLISKKEENSYEISTEVADGEERQNGFASEGPPEYGMFAGFFASIEDAKALFRQTVNSAAVFIDQCYKIR